MDEHTYTTRQPSALDSAMDLVRKSADSNLAYLDQLQEDLKQSHLLIAIRHVEKVMTIPVNNQNSRLEVLRVSCEHPQIDFHILFKSFAVKFN